MTKLHKQLIMTIGILCLNLSLFAGHTQAQDINIGVTWSGKSGMATRINDAMTKRLAEKAPQIKIELIENIPTIEDLGKVATKWQDEKKAMVILRSNGAEYLATHAPKIPTFIGACNDPTSLGAVKNLEHPEGNITGVTYAISYEVQLKTLLDLLPNTKAVLLLTEKDHPSGLIDSRETEKVCKKIGLNYTHAECTTVEDITTSINANKDKVDVIMIGFQSLLFDNSKVVLAAAGDKPVYSYSTNPVKAGALAALSSNDTKRGIALADAIIEVLINGKAIKDVPVFTDAEPILNVNVTTAEKLGLELPLEVLQAATILK